MSKGIEVQIHSGDKTRFTVIYSGVRAIEYDKEGLYILYRYKPIAQTAVGIYTHLWGHREALKEKAKSERIDYARCAKELREKLTDFYGVASYTLERIEFTPNEVHLQSIEHLSDDLIAKILKQDWGELARYHRRSIRG